MISQYLVGEVHEQSVFTALLLIQAFVALSVQLANIGSAAIFFLTALPLFVVLALNPLFVGSNQRISLWTYGLGQILPSLSGCLLLLGVVEVFVPLVSFYLCVVARFPFLDAELLISFFFEQTGRIGADAPADNIVATIISSLGAISFPLVLPFAHKFGRRKLLRGIMFLSVLMTVLIAVFASMEPFDAMHQKRLFFLHMENVSSSFCCLLCWRIN